MFWALFGEFSSANMPSDRDHLLRQRADGGFPWIVPSRLNMKAFCPEHPKWDQNPKFTPLSFTPLSETTSIPTPFIIGVRPPPPRGFHCIRKNFPNRARFPSTRRDQTFPIVLSGIVYDVAIQLRAHSGTGFSSVFLRGIPSFDKAKNGKLRES